MGLCGDLDDDTEDHGAAAHHHRASAAEEVAEQEDEYGTEEAACVLVFSGRKRIDGWKPGSPWASKEGVRK